MRTIKLKKHTVAFYDSIFETPIAVHKLHERYVAAAAFTVGNLDSYGVRIGSALNHLAANNPSAVETELRNLYFGLYQFSMGMDMNSLALLALVAEVDEKPYVKRDEESLLKLRDQMSSWGLTNAAAEKLAEDLKKKYVSNWIVGSPDGSE